MGISITGKEKCEAVSADDALRQTDVFEAAFVAEREQVLHDLRVVEMRQRIRGLLIQSIEFPTFSMPVSLSMRATSYMSILRCFRIELTFWHSSRRNSMLASGLNCGVIPPLTERTNLSADRRDQLEIRNDGMGGQMRTLQIGMRLAEARDKLQVGRHIGRVAVEDASAEVRFGLAEEQVGGKARND